MCIKVQDSLVCRDVSGDGVAWWDVGGGVIWEFNLGAWASAVTAIAAVAALYFARKAWMASQANAKAALEMLRLEQQRESRAEARDAELRDRADRAEQADLVAVWIRNAGKQRSIKYDDEGSRVVVHEDAYELRCQNASPLPVYNLHIRFIGLADTEQGRHYIEVLPPGGLIEPMPEVELYEHAMDAADGEDLSWWDTPMDLSVEIAFYDSAQRHWRRAGDGSLTRRVTSSRSTSWRVEDPASAEL